MEPGSIIFQGKVNQNQIIVRYPVIEDCEALQEFVNTISQECTFVRLQGEQFSLAEEAQYLEAALTQIKEKNLVKLLLFAGDELIAGGDITRQPMANSHLGRFGMMVKKEWRGQGIGKKLTQLLISEAKKQLPGVEIVVLSLFKQNTIARHVYQHFGFKQYGILPRGLKRLDRYDDEVQMYLEL